MKSNSFWSDFFDAMLTEHDVKVEVTKDSLRDLAAYYQRREHFIVAEEIETRIETGMYPPPIGDAISLEAPDQMYGKIKNRRTGLRIIYYPHFTNDQDHFRILVVGPRTKNEVYRLLSARLKKYGRPEKE